MYIAGEASAEGAGANDVLLLKFEAGTRDWLWTRMWGYFYSEYGTAMTIDPDGNIVVAGTTNSLDPEFGEDIVIIKYDPNGNLLSARAWGELGTDERCSAVFADPTGVTVAGSISGDLDDDSLVIRFDNAGNQLWARSFGGGKTDLAVGVSAGPDGGTAVTGLLDDGGILPRGYLVFFDGSGNLLREQIWSESPSSIRTMLKVEDTFILGGGAADRTGSWQVGFSTTLELNDRSIQPVGYEINTPPSSLLSPTGSGSVPVGFIEHSGGGGRDALIISYSPGSTI